MRATRRNQLAFIATVQVLAMATWFAASAVVPALRAEWQMGAGAATWLTIAVQLGFVAGAVLSSVVNLADVVPAPRLAGFSALIAAAATATIALAVDGFAAAVVLRFITGMALAGVYPVGLKLMASWFDRGRGLALGVLVAALTLGSAAPHMVTSFAALQWRGVLLVTSGLAAVGGLLALWFVRPGPYIAPAPPLNPGYVVQLFRERGPRLANLGYWGHMWELYAMWTWLPAFLAASYAGYDGWAGSVSVLGLSAFAAIGVAGVAGCLLGGWCGDRFGRARTASWAMLVSGACCLLAGAVFGLHPVVVLGVAFVWGLAVIADSALFSTCLTEVVDRRYVGTALTTQTATGFLLTTVTIQGIPYIVDWAGWRIAVVLLSVGPIAGAIAMIRLAAYQDRLGNNEPTANGALA